MEWTASGQGNRLSVSCFLLAFAPQVKQWFMVVHSLDALSVIGFIPLNANETAIGIHASDCRCATT
jgi:hypothetical protein